MASLVLEIQNGPLAGRAASIETGGALRVGRAPSGDGELIGIAQDSALSRNHFRIAGDGAGFTAEDLGSANGTLLNGGPIRGRVLLADGDLIEAGQSAFRIAIAGVAAPTEVAFPGYSVVEPLGEGNMGAIYLVDRDSDHRRFALKVLRPDADVSDTDVQRFLREAASMRALSHPNIVGFIDEGFVGGEFFFVMEYVEGVDLDLYRRQAGGTLSPRRAVDLVSELLSGLDYAHQQGFVHRDVKPANILIGIENGRMVGKLTDFGLAKKYEEVALAPITRGKIAFGTPDYMPPEQITRFRDVGPRSDIYSAGAALYHVLSGETVYAGVGDGDAIRTLLDYDPKPLQERAPWLPPQLCAVVHRALRRNPSERWPTAAAFRTALQALKDVVI